MKRRTLALMLIIAAVPATTTTASQEPRVTTDDEWCREYRGDRDRESYCEVREFTLAAPQVLELRQVANGSLAVTGSARSDVRLRARITASAPTVDGARQLARDVAISTDGGRVAATGPRDERDRHWSVSYRADVPAAQNVDLSTLNGSISIADLKSRVRASTSNGSLRLRGTTGDVEVHSANGSLDIQLAGTTWDGVGLRATAANGAVRLGVPEPYNARLRASTGNGSVSLDFPVPVQGRLNRDIDAQLGTGGPTLDVRTSNGSIRVSRAGGR